MQFVVCGEALIDLAPVDGAGDSTFRSSWEALSAGGPMNTAVALARLEEDVQFLGRLSSDRFGHQLRGHLGENRVGLDRAVVVDEPTSVAVVTLDEQGKASYAFHFAGTANFEWRAEELPELSAEQWFHFGSLLTVVEPGASVVLDWLRRCPARLSFDVNVRPAVIADPVRYWQAVEPWLAAVGARRGVVKGSDDDVSFLARADPDGPQDPVEAAAGWVRRFGLAVFVLTLGPEGAAAVLPDGTVLRVPGQQVQVEDTVGAGDTFMAGFLAAHAAAPDPADHDGLRAALEQGVAASAVVCGRQGAQPPTLAEVRRQLQQHG
ncbi:carbohydrate kinase [Auraticoccus sp. F435]|uniref:Carbohydrate kinase n=1 Tax=Auraticoccus cholistanensis TaxID=2656650 RepID=A0A6A9V1W3_9ACTN|nr:carbohydrate kinase [Auraticoccus cholistanensis]MVA77582.1 carbohydrate kinase [Auraticoccus cholistanensis]